MMRLVPDPAPAAAPTRVLYVGGLGRSGSTLLDRMLGELPGATSAGELVHLWQRGVVEDQLCACGESFSDCPFWTKVGAEAFGGWDTREVGEAITLQRLVDRNRYLPMLASGAAPPDFAARIDRYRALLGRLYAAVSSVAAGAIVVDSSKHASTAFVLNGAPDISLRMIHLVRDARGTAYSWTKAVRRPEVPDREVLMHRHAPWRTAARFDSWNLLLHGLPVVGVPTLFVRYEDLVADPRTQMGRIVRFAQLPEEGALDFVEDDAVTLGVPHSVSGNPMRFTSGRIPIRIDDEWRRALPPAERAKVTAIALPLLAPYGYLRPAA
jgi:Sulfotransferase family